VLKSALKFDVALEGCRVFRGARNINSLKGTLVCGIAGFNRNDPMIMDKMLESIRHRGPDDRGIYTDQECSLGHVRLSILDLSEAVMSMELYWHPYRQEVKH